MILSTPDIESVLRAYDRAKALYKAGQFPSSYLTTEEKNLLSKAGINWKSIYQRQNDFILQNWMLGKLSVILGPEIARRMTIEDVRKVVSENAASTLSLKDKARIDAFRRQHIKDVNSYINTAKEELNQIILREQLKMKPEDIGSKTGNAQAILGIAREIQRETGKFERDFSSSAAYISHSTLQESVANTYSDIYGPDVKVYKQPLPGACDDCIRLYLYPDGSPRIFTLSQMPSNNIGVKRKDWKATLHSLHPHCYDADTSVLTSEGWKKWPEVTGQEQFLSVDLNTDLPEWVDCKKVVKWHHKGEMDYLSSHRFKLMTTDQHYHVYGERKSNISVNETSFEYKKLADGIKQKIFLQGIRKYKGNVPSISKSLGFDVDIKDFVQFMAWYLSEGSISHLKRGKGLQYDIKISQEKPHYRKEIERLLDRMFRKVYVGKDSFYVRVKKDNPIIKYLQQFGKSYQKFIPSEIKNLDKDLLWLFIETYAKGDGHLRPPRRIKDHMSLPSYSIFTSSKQMMSDLTEIVMKSGFACSVDEQPPKTVKHKNGIYTGNHTIYIVRLKRKIYSRTTAKTFKIEKVFYDGMVYDVELEKNHTLFVMKNGSISLSGNCRCQLFHYQGLTEQKPKRKDRPKVKMIWNGQEYEV